MFYDLKNIIEIDLSNFDFSKATSLYSMFAGCSNLEKIEFGKIKTSSLENMGSMFRRCSKLKSIDLSKFDTSKVTNMGYMFNYCSSLEKIEFGNIDTSSVEYMYDMFQECSELTSLDLSKFNTTKVKKMNLMFYNCNKLKYLDISNFDTSNVMNIDKMFYNCSSLIYLNLKNFKFNNTVSKNDIFLDSSLNMIICLEDDSTREFLNLTISDCSYEYFKDNTIIDFENSNDNNTILTNKNCSRNFPFLLKDECVSNCSIIERQNKLCITTYINDTDKDFNSFDIIIEQIRYELMNNFNDKVIDGNTINEKDFNITLIRNNNQKGIIINFGQCEKRLKGIYNIDQNESLYLLRCDIEQDGMRTPSIVYELYYPINSSLEQLNLSECEGIDINITIPYNITDNLDKYNSSSEYYNDICYTTNSKHNTDIILSDRRNNYINDNMSLCQTNCKFISYNYETKNVICSCGTQTKIPLLKDIKFDKNIFLKNFININDFMHIKMLKCYKTVFKKKNILKNKGFFIFSGFILLNIIFLFIFCLKNFATLKNDIKKFKTKILKQNIIKIDAIDAIDAIDNNKKKNINHKNERNNNNLKIYNKNELNLKNKEREKINNNIVVENLEQSKNKRHKRNKKNQKNIKSSLSFNSIMILDNTKIASFNSTNKIKKSKLELNDSELNDLNFEDAIIKDKRTCFEYYISLVKINHSVIFIFNNGDYNSKVIKLSIFIFNLSSSITINALFFTDSTMHTIYIDEGLYNIIYQLPQIIYSALISQLLNIFIQFLGFSENTILALKNGSIKNINKREKEIIGILKKKFIFFYIIDFILMIAFLYYISCFCEIYKNTQIHLFKDSLISFGVSLVIPFIIYIFPGILRICGLNCNNEYIFGVSKILQLL